GARVPVRRRRSSLSLSSRPQLLDLCGRGPRGSRCAAGGVVGVAAARTLPPVGDLRVRPRAGAEAPPSRRHPGIVAAGRDRRTGTDDRRNDGGGSLMFEQFFQALGSVLNFFYTLIPSYGLSIMLLTVLVMALITPLNVKSTRSMLQMQRLQPEMKRLQAKYKDDREQLNAELMKFYRENKINPLGGCLPLLAQMPVFFIMYSLLRGLTVREGGLGSGIGHIAGQVQQGVELTPWVFTDQYFRPEHLNHSTELYQ